MEKTSCKFCIWVDQCREENSCPNFYPNDDLFEREYEEDLHMRQKIYEEYESEF